MLAAISLVLSCQSAKPKVETVKQEQQEDRDVVPVLESIEPADEKRIATKPMPTVFVSGVVTSKYPIRVLSVSNKLNREEKAAKVVPAGASQYKFSVNVPILPGRNELQVQIINEKEHTLVKNISYINGDPPDLSIVLETKELSPGDYTFFRVYLKGDGKDVELKPDEVVLKAQQGTFDGPKYIAPSFYTRMDVIDVEYPSQNARQSTKISFKKPKMEIKCKGPEQTKRGATEEYTVTIQNIGKSESLRNKIKVKIPESFQYVGAEKDGQYFQFSREISWYLDTLASGISEDFKFKLRGIRRGKSVISYELISCDDKIGEGRYKVNVIGECFVGEHSSNPKVVEYGKDATISVTLDIQDNIEKVNCWYELAERLECLSAEGIRSGNAKFPCAISGNKILVMKFDPEMPEATILKAGEKLQLNIRLKAMRSGKLSNTFHIQYFPQEGSKEESAKQKYQHEYVLLVK